MDERLRHRAAAPGACYALPGRALPSPRPYVGLPELDDPFHDKAVIVHLWRAWLELIQRGEDPALSDERARLEVVRMQENSFAAVAEDFIEAACLQDAKGQRR